MVYWSSVVVAAATVFGVSLVYFELMYEMGFRCPRASMSRSLELAGNLPGYTDFDD